MLDVILEVEGVSAICSQRPDLQVSISKKVKWEWEWLRGLRDELRMSEEELRMKVGGRMGEGGEEGKLKTSRRWA